MEELSIKTIMSREVRCMTPKTPISHVIRAMKQDSYSCMIITEDNAPVGVITERDIVRFTDDLIQVCEHRDPDAASIMSADLVTLHENASLYEALVVTRSNKIRHLPIVDSLGLVTGIVTYTDLVNAHFRSIEAQTAIIEKAITHRTHDLMEINEKLRHLSLEDPLLQIGNRRAMEVDLNYTDAAFRHYARPYVVILFDVDYFKLYNDHYGHLAGDDALKRVSALIKSSIRKSDRVYRYGGEEFLVLLPETSREDAHILSQRLIIKIVDLGIPHVRNPLSILTLSGGISTPSDTTPEDTWLKVLHRADQALYQAKTQGRARVVSLCSSKLSSQLP